MKSQKVILCLMTVSALISCGQNPSLEKKLKKGGVALTQPLNPAGPEENKELEDKLKTEDAKLLGGNFGEILLNQTSSITLKVINLDPELMELEDIKFVDSDQKISRFEVLTGDKVNKQNFIKIYYSPSSIGHKDLKVVAKIQTEGQQVVLDNKVKAKVVTNSKVKNGLKLYIDEQKDLVFGPISKGATATKDVLIENPADDAAFIEEIKFKVGVNFTYEMVDIVSGSKCSEQITHSCFIRIKFSPVDTTNLEDVLIIKHTYNGKDTKVMKIKVRGIVGDEASACVNSVQRMYFPKVKSDVINNKNIQLPYFVRSRKTEKVLNVLINNESNKQDNYLEGGISYVEDAQVITSFDLAKDNELGDINKVELASSLLKNFDIEYEGYRLTELLCLQNTMTCSGSFYKDKVYRKHINGNYKVVNEEFLSILQTEGKNVVLDEREFIDYSGVMDLSFISPNIGKAIRGDSNVNIVIADDIKLQKLPVLLVNYQKEIHNQCK